MERKAHTIRFPDGRSCRCYEDECVLEAMRRTRTGPVQHGCFGGGCGVCKMRVEGEYRITGPMSRAHVSEAEQAGGVLLICRIQPRGDLTLFPI